MVRLTDLTDEPVHEIPYRYPRTGGGVAQGFWPVHQAVLRGLPEGLGGLLLASDLQGLEVRSDGTPARLLGHAVAEEMAVWLEIQGGPPAGDVGVVLAGDLHVDGNLDGRGGAGDVREVWQAFRQRFRWVCGVAGNHDGFGSPAEARAFEAGAGIHYLDGALRRIDRMAVAGLGGIIGGSGKPFRRPEENYLGAVRGLLERRPDLLVLHECPRVEERGCRGSASLRRCLDEAPPALVVCGHCHWAHPGWADLPGGSQVVNTDGRVILALGR